MANEYYGVSSTPTSDYLAHYGVRGMKWGVRKSLSKGRAASELALSRQYRKAQKKLDKLNKRADVNLQAKRAKRNGAIAGASGALGLAGAGASIPIMKKRISPLKAQNKALGQAYEALDKSRRNNVFNTSKQVIDNLGNHKAIEAIQKKGALRNKDLTAQMNKTLSERKAIQKQIGNTQSLFRNVQLGSIAAGAVGAGVAGAKAIAAKYRTTEKGHAKAVAKRNAWRNQMAETFKGTKYASLPAVQKRKRRR